MKTIHINVEVEPLSVLRRIYDEHLKNDKTFHFVIWGGGIKWKGHKFTGCSILLRVDDKKVAPITKWLGATYEYEVYDFPFPDREGNKQRLGLNKSSVENRFREEFDGILHLYSVLSIKVTGKKDREHAMASINHLYTNVFGLSLVDEVRFHLERAYGQIATVEKTS